MEDRRQKEQLCELIAYVCDDPYEFALAMFPWGKPGTPLEKYPEGPDEVQTEILKGIAKAIQENNNLEKMQSV